MVREANEGRKLGGPRGQFDILGLIRIDAWFAAMENALLVAGG